MRDHEPCTYHDFHQTALVGFTVQQVSATSPPTYFLDATPQEEAAIPLRLLLLFSLSPTEARLQSMRLMGDGETQLESMTQLLQVSLSDIMNGRVSWICGLMLLLTGW